MKLTKGMYAFLLLSISLLCYQNCDHPADPLKPEALSLCNGQGLRNSLAVCSSDSPCEKGVVFRDGELHELTITESSFVPSCKVSESYFDDGAPLAWTDGNGTKRYTCLFDDFSDDTKRPLVIFMHGTGGTAGNAYLHTTLRVRAPSFVTDPNRPNLKGYVLAAVQGRNLHWPSDHGDGPHHDYYFRTLEENPDVEHLDHLIDTLVGGGKVDPKRIYIMGWSNGATFTQFYSLHRHSHPTSGGNYIAAASAFAFANPYASFSHTEVGCDFTQYPKSTLPIYLVNPTCDSLTACDEKQESLFDLPPGHSASTWFNEGLKTVMENENALLKIIGNKQQEVGVCMAPGENLCTLPLGTWNHLNWPNGRSPGAEYSLEADWEKRMLEFLGARLSNR